VVVSEDLIFAGVVGVAEVEQALVAGGPAASPEWLMTWVRFFVLVSPVQ